MSARAGFGFVGFIELGELLCGKRFPIAPKGNAYERYVWAAILYWVNYCTQAKTR